MIFTFSLMAVVVGPVLGVVVWLLVLRPYCLRNGKGFTAGANAGVTFWVDWQEAWEIATARGDKGVLLLCRIVLGLQILPVIGITLLLAGI